ncbi:hypothetical protein TWF281_009971 [Arthrobotrys megalospora]
MLHGFRHCLALAQARRAKFFKSKQDQKLEPRHVDSFFEYLPDYGWQPLQMSSPATSSPNQILAACRNLFVSPPAPQLLRNIPGVASVPLDEIAIMWEKV